MYEHPLLVTWECFGKGSLIARASQVLGGGVSALLTASSRPSSSCTHPHLLILPTHPVAQSSYSHIDASPLWLPQAPSSFVSVCVLSDTEFTKAVVEH